MQPAAVLRDLVDIYGDDGFCKQLFRCTYRFSVHSAAEHRQKNMRIGFQKVELEPGGAAVRRRIIRKIDHLYAVAA